jgi:hypothetical protein
MYMFGYLYKNNDNIYLWLMLGVAALLSPTISLYIHLPDVKVEEWIHNTQSVCFPSYIHHKQGLFTRL